MQRELTPKEQKVVDTFEQARPGLGVIALTNILNNDFTGWADIVESMDESKIEIGTSTASNSFMYRKSG